MEQDDVDDDMEWFAPFRTVDALVGLAVGSGPATQVAHGLLRRIADSVDIDEWFLETQARRIRAALVGNAAAATSTTGPLHAQPPGASSEDYAEDAPPAPSRAEILNRFDQLVDGCVSREEAARWASQWGPQGTEVADPVARQALDELGTVAARLDAGRYLQQADHFEEWRQAVQRAMSWNEVREGS